MRRRRAAGGGRCGELEQVRCNYATAGCRRFIDVGLSDPATGALLRLADALEATAAAAVLVVAGSGS